MVCGVCSLLSASAQKLRDEAKVRILHTSRSSSRRASRLAWKSVRASDLAMLDCYDKLLDEWSNYNRNSTSLGGKVH